MTTVVVDTNVVLVANGQHPDVSPECVAACADFLRAVMQSGRVAIDDGFRILDEYQHKTHPRDGERVGDVFVHWVLQHHGDPTRCDEVALVEHPERGFESFPDDPRLASFDPSDRKFVAVAAAHPERPAIAQAADSKWLGWSAALADLDLDVDFLCPADIHTFEALKKLHRRIAR